MTPLGPDEEVRRRQKSRSLVTAVLLGIFVILLFAITIAKMSAAR